MKPGDFVEFRDGDNPVQFGRVVELLPPDHAGVSLLDGSEWLCARESLSPANILDAYRAIEEEIAQVEARAADRVRALRAESRAAFERALKAGRP